MGPDLKSLLLFARENQGTELHLAVDAPVEILVGRRRRRLDVPAIGAAEFDALVRCHLDSRERAILESKGSIGSLFELEDVGLVRARIAGRAATFILPVAAASSRNISANGRIQFAIDRLLQFFKIPLFDSSRLRRLLTTRVVSETFFFSRLFPLPFLLVGLVVLYLGSSNLFLGHASSSWPSAPGTIERSGLKARKSSTNSRTTYAADVGYGFAVKGVVFAGNRVDFGSIGSYGSSDPSSAEDILTAYPPGRDVRVYYDPENPEESVLEPGITFYSCLAPLAGSAFLLVGLLTAIFLPGLMRRREPKII